MTWTAPAVSRTDPPQLSDERGMLDGWLDYHRATLLWKCAGLTGEDLARRATPPSTMTLLGLVRHMADVERAWFRRRLRGEDAGPLYWSDADPDGDFDGVDPAAASTDFATFAAECDGSRKAAAGASLEDTFVHPRYGEMSLRWVYVHMIEEYARHNGHADLLRESIDGVTGD